MQIQHFDYIFDRKQPRKVTRNDLKKSKIQNEHSQKIPKLLGFLDFCRCSLGLLIIAKMRAPKRKAARSNRAGDAKKPYFRAFFISEKLVKNLD